jgi:hypothetical protein
LAAQREKLTECTHWVFGIHNYSLVMQTPIRALFMRGGTSRGPFFKESDLPADVATRDKVLLAVMGSPDKRQIDGPLSITLQHPHLSGDKYGPESDRERADVPQ